MTRAAIGRMRRLACVAWLVGCTGGDGLGTDRESIIIGENDLIRVDPAGSNVPAKYRGVLDAIGRTAPIGCTVTHVGNGIALAAGHCFTSINTSRVDGLPCVSELGSTVTIEWGVRGEFDAQPYLVSSCSVLSLAFNFQGADYAILSVDPAPPRFVPVELAPPSAGELLTVFSHPGRRPLEWSRTCPMGNTRNPGVFEHTCDTEKGSSGAAVLDDTRLRVIGIHNGGDTINYATYLGDTPIAEFLGGVPPTPDPPPEPDPPPTPPDPPPGTPAPTFSPSASALYHPYTIAAGQWVEYGPVSIEYALVAKLTGDGDVDLYLRRGLPPTPQAYECRPYTDDSNESCTAWGPAQVYIALGGAAAVSNVGLELVYE